MRRENGANTYNNLMLIQDSWDPSSGFCGQKHEASFEDYLGEPEHRGGSQ